jgi:DNA-binding LacI/PurR family transcriptional regulator
LKIELYRQIATKLVAEIESGMYPEGQLFPRRTELAVRFGVTRVTINRALDILQEKGFVAAKRGSGTVVVSTRQSYNIAYIAPEWLMRYMPSQPGCNLEYLNYSDALGTQTQVANLTKYDGILWSHPDEKYIPQIISYQKKIPGIIINRAVPECNYVATEYSDFFRRQVVERLRALPKATPYFLLRSDANHFVHTLRLNGFIAACRDENRFYEVIELPPEFKQKAVLLESEIRIARAPLLIFADESTHTGALVFWAWQHDLVWKKDLYYMDFDNLQKEHVWGVQITSIMQDFYQLSLKALEKIILLIREPSRVEQHLIPPSIHYGDT